MAQGSGLVAVETSVCPTSGAVMDGATAEMAVTRLGVSVGASSLRQKAGAAMQVPQNALLSLDGPWL